MRCLFAVSNRQCCFIMLCILDCLQPDPAIENGFLNGSTKFGEVASIGCNAGYKVKGDATALCQTDGTWAKLPTCDLVGK